MHFKGLWRALFVALKQNTYTAFNASRKWVLKFPMRNVRQNTLRISSDCFFFHFTTDFCACVYSASCNRIKIDAQQVLTGTICSGLPLPLCSMLNWSCHKIRDAKLNFIVCIWSDQTPVIHRRTKCSTKKKKEVKIYFRHRWWGSGLWKCVKKNLTIVKAIENEIEANNEWKTVLRIFVDDYAFEFTAPSARETLFTNVFRGNDVRNAVWAHHAIATQKHAHKTKEPKIASSNSHSQRRRLTSIITYFSILFNSRVLMRNLHWKKRKMETKFIPFNDIFCFSFNLHPLSTTTAET